MLEDTRVFKPVVYYKESSGICRWDFFDRGRQVESVLRTERPDAVVMTMGTNDMQSVWQDGGWIAYGTSRWKTVYDQRMSDVMTTVLRGSAQRRYRACP